MQACFRLNPEPRKQGHVMALTKRIRVVRPEDEEVFEETPAEGAREAPESSYDDDDYQEHFTEDGDPVKKGTTVVDVIALCDQLQIGVNSLAHFGISFRFRRDRNKRLDRLIKQIEDIRVAIQFDEFMILKKERGD
jgi:hypothetical protein